MHARNARLAPMHTPVNSITRLPSISILHHHVATKTGPKGQFWYVVLSYKQCRLFFFLGLPPPGKKKKSTITRLTPELQAQYDRYKSTLAQISQKIGELESEADEHKLVLETLEPLNKDRKCFRMVGGVLVEKTVGDVIPLLDTTKAGLDKALQALTEDYKKTEQDLQDWQKKNKVQIVQT